MLTLIAARWFPGMEGFVGCHSLRGHLVAGWSLSCISHTSKADSPAKIFILIFVALFLVRDVPIAKILEGVGRMDATVKRVLQESIIITTICTILETTIQVTFHCNTTECV